MCVLQKANVLNPISVMVSSVIIRFIMVAFGSILSHEIIKIVFDTDRIHKSLVFGSIMMYIRSSAQ